MAQPTGSNLQALQYKMAGLDTIEVSFSAKAATGAVILLHGFGADFTDLVSLSEFAGTPESVRWYFPNGPHTVVLGPHMTGRAWFPLRMAELESKGFDYVQSSPEGMDKAIQQAFNACDAIRTKAKLKWSQIVLGGFSQGSMIAAQVAALAPETPAGLTIFSGALVNEPLLRKSLAARKGMPYFQSHGENDPLLTYEGAEALERVFNEVGLNGMMMNFRGGHEIPMPILKEWASWLKGKV